MDSVLVVFRIVPFSFATAGSELVHCIRIVYKHASYNDRCGPYGAHGRGKKKLHSFLYLKRFGKVWQADCSLDVLPADLCYSKTKIKWNVGVETFSFSSARKSFSFIVETQSNLIVQLHNWLLMDWRRWRLWTALYRITLPNHNPIQTRKPRKRKKWPQRFALNPAMPGCRHQEPCAWWRCVAAFKGEWMPFLISCVLCCLFCVCEIWTFVYNGGPDSLIRPALLISKNETKNKIPEKVRETAGHSCIPEEACL